MFEGIFVIAIVFAIVVPTVLLISAVILRAAVSLYNRLVGGPQSPRAVPEPSFKLAIGIAVLSMILGSIINMVVGSAVSAPAEAGWIVKDAAEWVPSTLLNFLAMAAVIAYLLPTRFPRALGVTLCHTAVCIGVAAVTVLIGISASALITGIQ